MQTGIVEVPDEGRPHLDYDKIGTEYQEKHGGIFMGYESESVGIVTEWVEGINRMLTDEGILPWA